MAFEELGAKQRKAAAALMSQSVWFDGYELKYVSNVRIVVEIVGRIVGHIGMDARFVLWSHKRVSIQCNCRNSIMRNILQRAYAPFDNRYHLISLPVTQRFLPL